MNSRIFDQLRVWRLDRQSLEKTIPLMGEAVRQQWLPEIVVGIARGGVEPARLLADYLGLPVYYVRAKHNSSDHIRSAPLSSVRVHLTDIARVPDGRRILLVDDICGTGKTLTSVSAYLRDMRHVTVLNTVTLCRNAGSQISPDLSVWTVRDWVVFPWEKAPQGVITEFLQLVENPGCREQYDFLEPDGRTKTLQAV